MKPTRSTSWVRRASWWALFAGILGAGAATGQAQPDNEAPEASAMILLYAPIVGRPAIGDVEIRAEVLSDVVAPEVVFFVDGREVARFTEPPYEHIARLGEANVEHLFEVAVIENDREIAREERNTPSIHVDDEVRLDLQQLYVTVEDRQGKRVPDLGRSDFEILDNGVEQGLVTFEGGDAALTAVVLIDASTSMRGARLEAALAGARAFVEGLRELDEASIVLFSDRQLAETPFVTAGPGSTQRLTQELAGVEAEGGTALHDWLYWSLKKLEARQGRRVVVLLSDGIDVHSALDAEDVLFAMQRTQSLIYWIELSERRSGGGVVSTWRDLDEHARALDILARVANESGGRILRIQRAEDAAQTFEEILEELREQYVLGYYPLEDRDDGAWHAVRVKVAQPSTSVRTRGGYLDLP